VSPTSTSRQKRAWKPSGVNDDLNKQITTAEAEAAIKFRPEQQQAVRLLTTMPGVGKTIAHTIVAEIGEIQRFHSPKAHSNLASLTPRVRQSAAITHRRPNTKRGSPFLQAAMTQAATIASRFSNRWYGVHERLTPRCGKQTAKVAVARHLLTAVFYNLKRNELYQEDFERKQWGA